MRIGGILSCLCLLTANLLPISGSGQVTVPAAYPSNVKPNYIKTFDVFIPVSNANDVASLSMHDARETTQYLDGLGRPVQIVVKKGSMITGSAAQDFVSATVYDNLGRTPYNYLSFAANTTGGNTSLNDGLFKLNPFQQQAAFSNTQYSGETYFYGQTVYEESPLSRELKSMATGNSWVGASRGVTKTYLVNDATAEPTIKIWRIADAFGSLPSTDGSYGTGQLLKNTVADEQGNLTSEYVDKQGKTLVKSMPVGSELLTTVYVYDASNRLRVVIPPKAVQAISSNWVMTQGVLDELCFRYEYDGRSRMVIKKVPGAGEVRMVYDAKDRMVMSQDANMRTNHQWMYMQYDELNRPLASGLLTDNTNYNNHAYHLSAAYASTAYPTLGSYTTEELTRTFYDNYDWLAAAGNPFTATRNTSNDDHLLTPSTTGLCAQEMTQSSSNAGSVTGTKTRILGTGNFQYAINYYDTKQRLIQAITQNIAGGIDIMTTQHDFSGKPLVQTIYSSKAGSIARTDFTRTQFEYDDLGRLTGVDKTPWAFFGGSWKGGVLKRVNAIQYDALGQLKKKKLGPVPSSSDALETLNYDYNIRGWMLGMNREYAKDANSTNYFGFDLGYDKASNGLIGNQSYSNPQYNGNIAGMVWKSKGDGEKRKYDFTYDAANRLLSADFNQYTTGSFNKMAGVDFSLSNMTYDANGNIGSMSQKGLKINSSSFIDQLSYSYASNSNKLVAVTDASNDNTSKLGDFKYDPTTKTSTDYTYDVNGNLTQDNNKAISSITYNHLNLPSVITVTGKGTVTYTYDAAGNKVKKVTVDNTVSPAVTNTTLYIGGGIYENDVFQFTGFEEGRMRLRASDNTFQFDYFLKDHLGNVRAVITEEQRTDMYPAATMETASATTEETFYGNISSTRVNRPSAYTDTYTNPNDKASMVKGDGNKIGPSILLKVMVGDQFNIHASSYWASGSPSGTTSPLSNIVTALAGGVPGMSGGKIASGDLTSTILDPQITDFLTNDRSYNSAIPKAYLNWILLDEQFKFVTSSSGADQVGGSGTVTQYNKTGMPVHKNGYLYIYVSNETNNIEVFFDNLQITHVRGRLLEETHYYPFGLTMAGTSSKALVFGGIENKRKWNAESELASKEFSDGSGLELYETFYRNLDPQLGKFWQIDPEIEAQESFSPYESMGNNPISNVDPLGDFKTRFGAWLHRAFVGGGGKIGKNEFGEWYVNKGEVTTSEQGETVIRSYRFYGKGRDKYSTAMEAFVSDSKIEADIRINGENSMYQMYDSPDEAGKAALSLWTGVVLPNPVFKTGTAIANSSKTVAEVSNGTSTGVKLLNPSIPNLTQKVLDHIIARHWGTSGAKGAGKFTQGTTGAGLKDMIQTAATKGAFRANTGGRAGTIVEYNFGRVIGTTSGGASATNLRVVIGTNGNVITAFPF